MSNQTLPGLTLPEGIELPQQSPLAALLGGLGGGLSAGTGEALKSKLLGQREQALALQKSLLKEQEPMTEFQKLSVKLREQEQDRKIQTAMTQEFLKLGDPFMKTKGISADDILPLSTSAVKIMKEENVPPAEAMDEAVSRFQIQKGTIEESKLPKFNLSKKESLKKDIINSLKKGEITNRTLINRDLMAKGWPAKDRQEILNKLKPGKKLTPQIIDRFLKQANDDPDKAKELAEKAGYEVRG